MFDLGALGEVVVIAVAILILFGPKEIPELLKLMGRWVGKARSLIREVQNQMDTFVHESELADYKKKANTCPKKKIQDDSHNPEEPS